MSSKSSYICLIDKKSVGEEIEKVPLSSYSTKKTPTDFFKPKRLVKQCFIHCSASDNQKHDNVATIAQWHKERGFSEIGYHFIITKDGIIYKGRDLEKIPAAQKESKIINNKKIGGNTGTIAICLTGEKQFSEKQFDSLKSICKQINDVYNKKITFHGHCEVAQKLCPVFDYKAVLKLDQDGNCLL